MKIDDLKYVKIPFTLYDLFGYLIPGLFFFTLFPITHDLINLIHSLANNLRGIPEVELKPMMINEFNLFIQESPWVFSLYSLLIAYLMGHLIAALSSFFYERILIEKFLKYPTANMFLLRKHQGSLEKIVYKIFIKLPLSLKSLIFGNYRRPYSKEFVSAFKTEFVDTFKYFPEDQSDIFWLCFSFVNQKSSPTFQRASHFLNLYGFARNLSMTFNLFAICLFCFEISLGVKVEIILIIMYLFIGIVFFWQYLKFFRRLNDEIFRGFISIKKSNDK